jgi:UDP-N-acetylglucosamine 2-epimerase (non-hydrolysing)
MAEAKESIMMVVGTRPDAIKFVPLIRALRDSEVFRPTVFSTGQHHRMVGEVLDLAGIEPEFHLWVGAAHSRLNNRLAGVVGRLDDLWREEFGADGTVRQESSIRDGSYPVAALVHGDNTSAMAAALACFHLKIPVVHVEAGLRSGNDLIPYPEEMNRQIITRVSRLHMAPTRRNMQNLIGENIPAERILVTGNTGIDALQWAVGLQTEISDHQLRELYDSDRRLVVITAHRRENWDLGIEGIALGVRRLAAENPDVSFLVAQHPNPLVQEKWTALSEAENVHVTGPAPYAEFAKLLARCYFVITDSGGIQEEAPSLGKPVLVARESTERTEGVEAGTLILTGTDPGVIYEQGARLFHDADAYQRVSEAKNPYGDGRASERIVAALEELYCHGDDPEPFGSGFSRGTAVEEVALSMPYSGWSESDSKHPQSSLHGPGPQRDFDEVRPTLDEITESGPSV